MTPDACLATTLAARLQLSFLLWVAALTSGPQHLRIDQTVLTFRTPARTPCRACARPSSGADKRRRDLPVGGAPLYLETA
jgi:hypothetical protein